MKLQRKTLIILALTVFGMILAIYLILSGIMTESYKKLEIQTSIQNSKRVYNALYNKIDNINILVADWAQWDDTYEFVVDRNKDYIKSNLTEATFIQDELNMILYYNKKNQIIWGKGFDLENEEFIQVPDSLKKYIADHSSLLLDQEDIESNVMGIVLLPEGPMMLCSNPILNSESEGPVRGRLFMGRYLDSTVVEQLSDTTHFDVSIHRIDEGTSDTILKKAVDSFSELSDTVIEPINSDTLSAFTQIKDVSGKPILVMKTNMPRSIYMQGQTTIKHFLILLFVIGLIFCFITILLLERLVLSRVYKLSSAIDKIGFLTDFSGRVDVEGNDELSDLGNNINTMLERLEESQEEIKAARDQFEERVEERTQELSTTLGEKEVLLKEIHHRVKNNLQVISSLLYHQSQYTNEKTKELFQKSQDRVKSMALIHESLYSSKDFSIIDFAQYIKKLTNHLKTTYIQMHSNSIDINTDIQNVSLNMETALPCGLIVNELVTNSLKHAFPNGNKGNIIVNMTVDDDSKYRLTISDNGIGLPKDINITNLKSLGLKLAKRLSEQLEGTFDIDLSNGTTFNITFNKNQKNIDNSVNEYK